MTYISWSSDFALYLQDYLLDEHHGWYNGSMWPIIYGPVILLLIWKTVWWRNIVYVFGIMDQCNTKINLVKYMWVSDLYFMVHWFCHILSYTWIIFIFSELAPVGGIRAPPGTCCSSSCGQQKLIRLGRCPDWSESSLGAQVILFVLSCGSSLLCCTFSSGKDLILGHVFYMCLETNAWSTVLSYYANARDIQDFCCPVTM